MKTAYWLFIVTLLSVLVSCSPPSVPREFIKAIKSGDVATVERFLASGVDVESSSRGSTALMFAVDSHRVEVVELLLNSGADVENYDGDALNWTPLMVGYYSKSYDASKLLLQKGANPNVVDSHGYPLLILAVKGNSCQFRNQFVKLLIENDVDLSARHPKTGETASEIALRSGDEELVMILSKGKE